MQSLKDLIRTFVLLAPENKSTREAIARLLGFETILSTEDGKMTPGNEADSGELVSDGVVSDQTFTDHLISETATAVHPEPRPRPSEESIPFTLHRLSRPLPAIPTWLKNAQPLAKPREVQKEDAFKPEPLFRPELRRSILTTLLSTLANQGPINLEIVIDTIAKGGVLRSIPSMPVPTLARGIQLLVDRGESMLPFREDVKAIEKDIGLLVGDNALKVLRFAFCPTRGVGEGSIRTWREYFDSYNPVTGTPVICVSDLGIGRPPDPSMQAAPDEWLSFAARLRKIGCNMVALVPYSPSRWPSQLAHRISIIHWDHTNNAAHIGRILHDKRGVNV